MAGFVISSLLFFLSHSAFAAGDVHFHFVSPENYKEFGSRFSGPSDAKLALSLERKAKINRVVALSAGFGFTDRRKSEHENNFVAEQAKAHPKNIIGFCGVPYNSDWAVEEVERCVNDLHLKGLKLRVGVAGGQSKTLLPRLKTLFAVVDRLKIPVLIHLGVDVAVLYDVVNLMQDFPNTKFILAHGQFSDFRELPWIAEPQIKNIYIEISVATSIYANSPERKNFRWAVKAFGIDHILFGTDYPLYSPTEALKATEKIFSKKEVNQILNENFDRVFGIK